METTLAGLIRLRQFPTGRRLFAFYRVLEVANKQNATVIVTLAQSAISADEDTVKLEQRWAQIRRSGNTSAKQVKAQNALQVMDVRLDRALTGLRNGAESTIRGAGDDEKALIEQVEYFLNEILPNGVAAVTSKSYPEESVAVKGIVARLVGDLAPTVTTLGLTLNVNRLVALSAEYEDALAAVETIEFGKVKAARELGQDYLLRLTAKIMGTYDEPTGPQADVRAALLAPILKQDEAIGEHIRARRNVPDVDPSTGEEQAPGDNTVEPADGNEPAVGDGH
jgi:hypothetical protein